MIRNASTVQDFRLHSEVIIPRYLPELHLRVSHPLILLLTAWHRIIVIYYTVLTHHKHFNNSQGPKMLQAKLNVANQII